MNCHGQTTPSVHPVDKARIQWQRFFKRDIHRPTLNLDTDVKDQVLDFLLHHAADSDQPMVPGL